MHARDRFSSELPFGFSSAPAATILLHAKDRPMIVDRIADRQRAVALAEDVVVFVRLSPLCEPLAADSSTAVRARKSARTAAILAARSAGSVHARRGAGRATRAARRRSDRVRASATPSVDALKGKRSEVPLAFELILDR